MIPEQATEGGAHGGDGVEDRSGGVERGNALRELVRGRRGCRRIDRYRRSIGTHVPGHTSGSCLLEFREHGVVFVGDLLCTVSPVTARPACPQLQTRGSNPNSAQALASLDRLEVIKAELVLAGHGGPWHGGAASAVASARRIGCR